MEPDQPFTCAKLPAEAVHTPAVTSPALSGMQAIALEAARTLKDPWEGNDVMVPKSHLLAAGSLA
jgi:hypothetical protein